MTSRSSRPPESCRQLFERLSEYVDGELDPSVCDHIEQHLDGCSPCQVFLESLRRTVRWVSSLPSPELGDDLQREVREACDRLRRERGR